MTRPPVGPRKHRNAAEKQAIVDEAVANTARLALADDHPALAQLTEAMGRFLALERGVVEGRAEAADLGCAIEYCLPTRRVQRHYVRVVRMAAAARPPPGTTNG